MKKYKSIEAKQAVDYINGIAEKCYRFGLLGREYPDKSVKEIVKSIADELEYAKVQSMMSRA